MLKIKINTQKIKYFISGVIVSGLLTSTIAFANPIQQFILQKSEYPMLINGNSFYSNSPVLNYEGSTYIPLKDVGSLLHCDVKWNSELKRIEINQNSQIQKESKTDGETNCGGGGGAGSSVSVNSNADKYNSSKPITTQVQELQKEAQTVQETRIQPQQNTSVSNSQTQVQQSKSEYEILKDYPVPESSPERPVKYNGVIYMPLRLGAEIYDIWPNLNYDNNNKTIQFTKTNTIIELNSNNSIYYQGIYYLKEDYFKVNTE